MIFGEKVAVSEGTFGAKKSVWWGCNFEKKVSFIVANDKNPLEDRCFLGGGAFWRIEGGGFLANNHYLI